MSAAPVARGLSLHRSSVRAWRKAARGDHLGGVRVPTRPRTPGLRFKAVMVEFFGRWVMVFGCDCSRKAFPRP